MAENVILSVQLNGAEAALQQLTQLDNVVNRLKANRNVNIKVSASGITSAANQAAKLDTNLTNAGKAAQQIGTTGAQSIGNAGTALTKASRNAESFHLGLGNVLGTMLKFRAASMAVNFAFSAFSSALNEMKAVDTELVNIRKVTGYTNEEVEKLSKTAFSLATNYGRSASEVLEASTTFARAGYTEQIEQLSELSLLLQNVGDLNAEDASKFLIATDKAYKLGGSYEELMAIIDGLDNITNKNATDMQKMTEGMTVAGSVFAESGESVEVFAALLGTATAATQRSGSEVGRALRTILMNLRQIRGETEDGELIDGESIAAASKALKDYAGISTMENGELRKASDILGDLAEKWDTLTETQQAAIAEAVAGKRQANILMALMGDWGSYEKMLDEYQNAAGTAARENEIYMDSWEAKTKQVSAAWNELIASIVDTDAIRGLLDLGVDLLGLLQNLISSPIVQGILDVLEWAIGGAIDIANGTIDWVNDMFLSEEEALERAEESAKNAAKTAEEVRDAYEKDYGAGSRYEALKEKILDLTEAEKVELGVLESKRREREAEAEAAEKAAKEEEERAKALADQIIEAEKARRNNIADSNLSGLYEGLYAANNEIDPEDIDAYTESIERLVSTYSGYYQTLINARDAGQELTEQENRFLSTFEIMSQAYVDGGNRVEQYGKLVAAAAYAYSGDWELAATAANEAMEAIAESLEDIPDAKTITIQVDGGQSALDILQSVKSAVIASAGGVTAKYAGGTGFARGGPALVNEKGPELIAANGLAWIAGGGKPTVTMLPHGATVLTAEETRRAMGGFPAYASGTGSQLPLVSYVDPERAAAKREELANVINSMFEMMTRGGEAGTYRRLSGDDLKGMTVENHPVMDKAFWAAHPDLYEEYQAARRAGREATDKFLREHGMGGGAGGGGETGPTPPNFKALEDDLSKLLKNLDAQAKLAENEEDFLKAMMVYGDAQSAIAELLEQYRANGYAEDSDEVLRLANLGYDYAAKQLGGYDKLQQSLIDALNGLTKATDDANELQERREAVDKAREALQNAERQRTVRIFNPVTGQWEWVANAADVQKAQEKLQSAEESLRKEELSKAVDAIKNASPADLGNMTLSPAILEALFGGTPEQQTAFLNALGAATGGADWLSSSEAQTPWNQGNSIGTQYNLNGITLTEAQASGMTIKDLIAMLQGLKIM